jgi:hypothetical protein
MAVMVESNTGMRWNVNFDSEGTRTTNRGRMEPLLAFRDLALNAATRRV